MNAKSSIVSNNTIKFIAIITMLIDHISAALLFPYFLINQSVLDAQTVSAGLEFAETLRIVGRIAFPLFCFLIVEGFFHTRNFRKYFLTLVVFAFISEIPFDLAFYWLSQNVLFTLAIGLATLFVMDKIRARQFNKVVSVTLQIFAVIIGCWIAETLNCDYASTGVLFIVGFYIFRGNKWLQILSMAVVYYECYYYLWNWGFAAALAFCCLTILLYNGQRGKWNLKYFFYTFYPAHLLIIALIGYHFGYIKFPF